MSLAHSALELEFIFHYMEMDRESGPWTGTRVRRLCNLLQITPAELARYIRVTPGALNQFIMKGKFPACIRLLLELVERTGQETYIGTHKSPLLPNLEPHG